MEEKNILLLYFEGKQRLVELRTQTFRTGRREWKSVTYYIIKIFIHPKLCVSYPQSKGCFYFYKKYSDYFSSLRVIWQKQTGWWSSYWLQRVVELKRVWRRVLLRVAIPVVVWVGELKCVCTPELPGWKHDGDYLLFSWSVTGTRVQCAVESSVDTSSVLHLFLCSTCDFSEFKRILLFLDDYDMSWL